ncbi:MAG: hypothetical protein GY925_16850 [Actinomycetia bacterium]|nr:hypothetical protein [Actinomycetes bacterium]
MTPPPPPPDPEEPTDWGGILCLSETQHTAITDDPAVAAAWRWLAADVQALPDYLGIHTDSEGTTTYQCRHRLFREIDIEAMLEVCDSAAARAEIKAERAAGGVWKARARGKTRSRVRARTPAERRRRLEDNKDRRRPPAGR